MRFYIKKLRKEIKEFMLEHHFSGHDFAHVERVNKLCKFIGKIENADLIVLEFAALLHDAGRDFERKNPSIDHAVESAIIAERILNQLNFPSEKLNQVIYAIKSHRFSNGIIPSTLEAKILQDADRIDSLGAVGIAMTFAYGGAYNRHLYDYEDPFAEKRELNDKLYSLDHFCTKLLKLPDTMHTEMGKKIAEERKEFLQSFLEQFGKEITGSI